MKITQRDGRVYFTSEPDAEGLIHETHARNLANAHAGMIRHLRAELDAGGIDLTEYTIYHVDLARALLSPLGRLLWPTGRRNAAAYSVVDSAGCACRTCQAIREEQGRDPLDTCGPQARYTLRHHPLPARPDQARP